MSNNYQFIANADKTRRGVIYFWIQLSRQSKYFTCDTVLQN